MPVSRDKLVMIGTGAVGATSAFAIVQEGLVNELVLIDANRQKAEGEVMDLNHGLSLVQPMDIRLGDYPDCAGAGVIVIAAGSNQKPGETRTDLLARNAAIFKQIIGQIVKYNTEAILLILTNPVDALSYATLKYSGYEPNRVIGSGTVLDTARLRQIISARCVQADPRNIHGYILGEHGDSEVAAWSTVNIAGVSLCDLWSSQEDCQACFEEIAKDVRDAAYEIIERKGATYYAIALSVCKILRAIVRNEHAVLTVSTLLQGEYGMKDLFMSVPCILGENGIERVLCPQLEEKELQALQHSGECIRANIKAMGL